MFMQVCTLEGTVQSQLTALESTVLAQSSSMQQHSADIDGQGRALQLLTAQVSLMKQLCLADSVVGDDDMFVA